MRVCISNLAFCVTALFATLPVYAQQPMAPAEPVVVTHGEGLVQAAPDRAWITISAESRASTAREAQKRNTDAMTPVLAKLKSSGVAADAIRTIVYDVQYEWDFVNGKRVGKGYVARNTVEVRVDSVDRVGEYRDAEKGAKINASGNLELPFGKGRRWLTNGWASKILGGFQMTNIINISSGAPLTIGDARGTLNRAGRSGLQAATSTLTTDEIKKLVGIFNTPNGIFFINPSVLQVTSTTTGANVFYDVTKPLPAGITPASLVIRAASPIGTAPFAGQVFFHNPPGSTGNLPMYFLNGPWYFNWNAGFFRNFKFGETAQIQIRAEAFNVLNRPSFSSPGSLDVSSTSFGRINGTSTGARIVQFGFRLDF